MILRWFMLLKNLEGDQPLVISTANLLKAIEVTLFDRKQEGIPSYCPTSLSTHQGYMRYCITFQNFCPLSKSLLGALMRQNPGGSCLLTRLVAKSGGEFQKIETPADRIHFKVHKIAIPCIWEHGNTPFIRRHFLFNQYSMVSTVQ